MAKLKVHDIAPDKLKTLTKAVMSTDRGDITIEFYPDVAPNTVANFYTLAKDGYYDGMKFHRVRSSAVSGYAIFCRCSGVKLSTSAAADFASAEAVRCEATTEPMTPDRSRAAATRTRGRKKRFMPTSASVRDDGPAWGDGRVRPPPGT